jgi:hypothetical protein
MNPLTINQQQYPVYADEEWKQFMARQSVRQTEHLERIREYTGWLIAVIGFMLVALGLAAVIF